MVIRERRIYASILVKMLLFVKAKSIICFTHLMNTIHLTKQI